MYNATGSQAVNGRAVKGSNSSTGDYPNLKYSDTTSFLNARVTGVLTNVINNGKSGYATVVGSVGVDTTDATLFDWTPVVGDSVFLNDAGTYSNARAAIFSYIGEITVAGIDGKMLVKPTTVVADPKVSGFIDIVNTKILAINVTALQVSGYDTSTNEGMMLDTTVGSITVPYDGSYEFTVNMYGTADINKQEMYAIIWDATNSAELTRQVLDTNIGANNTGSISYMFKASALANTQYVVKLAGDAPYTFSLQKLQFSVSSSKINTGF